MKFDYVQLGNAIRDVYKHFDAFQFDKHIPAFTEGGAYAGDVYMMTAYESRPNGEPPIFYHNASPYDIVSKKAPDYAVVFQGGELKLQIEFTNYVAMRTAVMTPLVMRTIGINSLVGKKVLFVGTGRIACHALCAMKAHYSDLAEASFVNSGSDAQEFIKTAEVHGVHMARTSIDTIGEYDVIVCHTNSKQPVLRESMVSDVKKGAFISAFTSEDLTEVAKEFYDTLKAAVIIDWRQTATESLELKDALAAGIADESELVLLGNLVSGTQQLPERDYTIYRSHGTPMQNLATLKLLMGLQK